MNSPVGAQISLLLPPRFSMRGGVLGNEVRQLGVVGIRETCRLTPFSIKRVKGYETTLQSGEHIKIISAKTVTDLGSGLVLLVPGRVDPAAIAEGLEHDEGRWLNYPSVEPKSLDDSTLRDRLAAVTSSWSGAFSIRESGAADGAATKGLRRPQVGALYAALAHLTRSSNPATIVMPTGTGKTETMLALNVHQRFERLLVVVPTDPLRDQIAGKFETFGVLRQQECLGNGAAFPAVMRLAHIPADVAEVDQLFDSANIIVTTMAVSGRADATIQERMAARASALFIDEAHHIAAPTWARFRGLFIDRTPPLPIFQFTATPFREDGRKVDGEFIYTYPLKKAQSERCFKPIRFEAVFGLDQKDADREIAAKVCSVLRKDLADGFNHLAIARCSTVERAKVVHRLYQALAPDLRPVLVHSKMSSRERGKQMAALRACEGRIVVCVDMLGEGFDLPQLKIAGLHDPHKSIAITIQFVGRITRQDPTLGDATVVANTGVDDIDRSLAKLYAEDADWNALVESLSSAKIESQIKRAEMFKGFVGELPEFPLQTLEPSMNAVIYRTSCDDWDPLRAEEIFAPGTFLGMKVNRHKHVAIFITRTEEFPKWTSSQSAKDVTWDLYLMHWNPGRNLLYIGCSTTGQFDRLARAVCGDGPSRLAGEDVFRSLHGFKRLIIRNLGLTHHQGRGVRYSMYMGVDVATGLDSAKGQRIKNNVFATGFLDGVSAVRGCSAKGKFWSIYPVRDLSEWVDWCDDIGRKVLDGGITTDQVFKSAMRPKQIDARPPVPPVAIHWPESLLMQLEDRIEIQIGDDTFLLTECDIELLDHERTGPLRFCVRSDAQSAEFEVQFADGGARYPQKAGAEAKIRIGGKLKTLTDSFGDESPQIDFGDGSLLIYSHLYSLPDGEPHPPYPAEKIVALDWSGTNIRKESQGPEKAADSVQKRVIEELLQSTEPFDIIFDDDGAGEVADVVCIRIVEGLVQVLLYHCKFSSEDAVGRRVKDLYEVCGQAQKSARWRDRPNRMFHHMLRRERLRIDAGLSSRFETGTAAQLKKLKISWDDYRYEFEVKIVQPGLSRGKVTPEQLHLLAGVETYLLDTRGMHLEVIGSK